jgi:hypothetical protein
MISLLRRLLEDESGIIISSEIVIVGTILVIGSIVGLATLSAAVTHELADVARACDSMYSNPHDNSSGDEYSIGAGTAMPEIAGSGY